MGQVGIQDVSGLYDLLVDCWEYLDQRSDVVDGDNGESRPNQAMQLCTRLDEYLDGVRTCVRWGKGEDRCVKLYDHLGPCSDAQGNTTLSLAAKALGK